MDRPSQPGRYTGNPLPGAGYVNTVNQSGGTLAAGDLVCLRISSTYLKAGKALPVTTTTVPDSSLVAGVVEQAQSTIPNGAPALVQVCGLHEAAKVNGNEPLTAGDFLGAHNVAGVLAKTLSRATAVAIYDDADYSTDATATKRVFLLNPLGLRHD